MLPLSVMAQPPADKPWLDYANLPQDYDYPLEGLSNKPQRLEWLQDAGFGMFIHFGVDSQLGSVISHSVMGASDDYLDRFYSELPKTFNPKRFDPEEIAILAKLAGMKYIVFTAKHHSGFCMWNTKTTDFNIMNTPYGNDLLAEDGAAVRKVGLAGGLYYSPEDALFVRNQGIMPRRAFDEGPAYLTIPEKNKKYAEFVQAQCTELMTNYGKIDVIFFDGPGNFVARETCWKIQPDLLVTRGAIETPEQRLPGLASAEPWEACITMGNQWQYKPTTDDYKSGTRLIEILIETRAKGGALLLNVGPKPDGALPIEQEARLREIALWHFVNHEAIHSVRPWIISSEQNLWLVKAKDSDTVYVFITKIPDWTRGERKEFILRSVKATPGSELSVLGQNSKYIEYRHNNDPRCLWEQKEDGLHLSVVRAQRLYNNSRWPNPVVMKLTHIKPALDSMPAVETLEEIKDGNTITLRGKILDLGSAGKVTVGFEYRLYAGFAENLHDDVWPFSRFTETSQTGEFQIPLDTPLEHGKRYQYRAVLKHPKITVYGDIESFSLAPEQKSKTGSVIID